LKKVRDTLKFICLGGNPELVKKSQRERFADESLVDKVIELDALARTGNKILFSLFSKICFGWIKQVEK
jgi:seryl-tRNA synthetase